MPPTRLARRAVTNENDENGNTRVTRARAAALDGPSDGSLGIGVKKHLQAKKSAANVANDTGAARKRTALGDVSNVNKVDLTEPKEGKKPLASKAAQPTGIEKVKSTTSGRSVLGARDSNAAGNDLKRPASVASTTGNVQKKRATASSSSRPSLKEEDSATDENVAPPSNASVKVEITESVKTTTTSADGTTVEEEIKREETRVPNSWMPKAPGLAKIVKSMDAEDETDPLMVGEYVYEIVEYMKELEQLTAPNPSYMDNQRELEWRMRGVLVDWLLEVHTRFHLLPETFYLTVNIIDRFLSCKQVHLDRLQLVGVTAMFIASKYEEVLSPHIGNFSHVADDGFTEEEILSAERYILAALEYNLSFPNPMHFMRRISKADNYDIQTRTLAKYLLEISLLDHRFLQFSPSINAAASMHLARTILDKGEWDDVLQHYSGYSEDEIRPALETMIDYLQQPVQHDAFYKKYAAKKFLKASLHARAWAKKHVDPLSQAVPRSP